MRYCLEAKDGPGDIGPAKNDPLRGRSVSILSLFSSSPVHRFKVVVSCSNIDQFGFPSFITSYNAKPVLIRNTGTLIRLVFCPLSPLIDIPLLFFPELSNILRWISTFTNSTT
jgi:hypothetical protein